MQQQKPAAELSAQEILEKLGLLSEGQKGKFTKEQRAAVKAYKSGEGIVSKADAKAKAEAEIVKDRKFIHKESCYAGKGALGDWHQ